MSQRSRSRLLVVVTLAGLLSAATPSGDRALSASVARRTNPGGLVRPDPSTAVADQSAQSPGTRGATTTRLADGRWLVVGGESSNGAVATARVVDPRTGASTSLVGLQLARTAHTATLLSDGTVLIAGGRGLGGQAVGTAELFDPQAGTFLPVTIVGARARLDHTATLLTDGRVLIAGGAGADGAVDDAELWDVGRAIANRVPGAMTQARAQHEAELLADGRVRVSGGVGADGARFTHDEIFDPESGVFTEASRRDEDRSVPRLAASMPESGAAGVPLDVRLALRFSHPLQPDTVSVESFMMNGPDGAIDVSIVAAEQGRLAFVSPRVPLLPDTSYVLTIDGAVDRRGVPVVPTSVVLTTRQGERPTGIPDQEAWTPDGQNWRSQRQDSPWQALKPLAAPPGMTALAGQVLRLDGRPLADVTLAMEGRSARTDRTGRFLLFLEGVTTGEHTFDIDARTANRPNRTYGFYEVRWRISAGRTNVLPFTIWSPLIDTAHQVTISSPTTRETVITTPTMPGFELHLPAGTTIVDEDHNVVRTVSLTPIPLDRTPFPLPEEATFTMFFTIQPGGGYLRSTGYPKGGWVVYPPAQHARIGQRVQFFNYDPNDRGWYVYGMGTVGARGVVPDPKTRIYGFAGASFNDDNGAPPSSWNPPGDCCRTGGDPVDLATGIFTFNTTDATIPDVMPLVLTRSYNSQDPAVRAFGRGMMDPYRMYLYTQEAFEQADLILADGARIHYLRTSENGRFWYQTEFEHTTSPTRFYKSTIKWSDADNGWHLRLKDGTLYVFGHGAPLKAIRDRNGNETRFTWSTTNIFGSGLGNLVRVTSPNGRWLDFTYHPDSKRVYQVKDNVGRTWTYGYDANQNLTTVTDPENHATTYLYNAANQMTGVRPRNLEGTTTNLVTNEYTTVADSPTPIGWVKKQTHADGGVYQFAYTVVNGKSIETMLTEPRGTAAAPQTAVRRVTLNSAGYMLTDTHRWGEPEAETTVSDRPASDNFISMVTDTSGARTASIRDGSGNVTSVTRCGPGQDPCTDASPGSLTTRYTYEPSFSRIQTITDPLNHTTTFGHNDAGDVTSVINALQHETAFGYDAQGQRTSVTDPLEHTTAFGYTGGDLTTVTDPLTRVTTRVVDAIGRVRSVTNPIGETTRYTYDDSSRLKTLTDTLNGQTSFTYTPGGQLETVTDANQHTTRYTYDVMGRIATRTDPLLRKELFTYDLSGNLRTWTDRKGQVTTRTYDLFDRLHQIEYSDAATITYTYDDHDRVAQIDDSASGASIVRTYDDFDRVTSETTPQGLIGYTYDDADRRATMTRSGQPVTSYTYDNADRLSALTRDTLTVTMTYDDADRRTTLTLPNGIVTEYGYDDNNQITAITYRSGGTTVGALTYAYGPTGLRTSVGSSWARIGLPAPVTSATYDAGNQLTSWGGSGRQYDANGSLASDGLTSYVWDTRQRLSGTSGADAAAFGYDATGRRISATIGGASTEYLYDGANTASKTQAGQSVQLISGESLDEWFARIDDAGTKVFLRDALGSTVALSNAAGEITDVYTYEPFGAGTSQGITASAEQFTGREQDSGASYYYRARYYRPAEGRFLSEDAIRLAPQDSLYAYVGDNPVSRIDPTGRLQGPLTLPGVGAGAGAGAAAGGGAAAGVAALGVAALVGFDAWIIQHDIDLLRQLCEAYGSCTPAPSRCEKRPPTLSRCLDACEGGPPVIKAFCNSIADKATAARCWAQMFESVTSCKNWCHGEFGR